MSENTRIFLAGILVAIVMIAAMLLLSTFVDFLNNAPSIGL